MISITKESEKKKGLRCSRSLLGWVKRGKGARNPHTRRNKRDRSSGKKKHNNKEVDSMGKKRQRKGTSDFKEMMNKH